MIKTLSAYISGLTKIALRPVRGNGFWGEVFTESNSVETLSARIVNEMETDHLRCLIQEAFVWGNHLVLTNKAGRKIYIDFNIVPSLQNISIRDRQSFEIQDNGSCLYWQSADIHLDYESFLYHVDNEFREQCDKQKAAHRREFGKAIAIVRINYGISINGVSGLEPNEIEDIESGRVHAKTSYLSRYSGAIGISLDDFLNEVAACVDILKAMEAIA